MAINFLAEEGEIVKMSNGNIFDIEANVWDTEERVNRAKVFAEYVRKAIAVENRNCAMELGCGTGLLSLNLLDMFKKIVCVDTSTGMLAVLEEKIKKQGISNVVTVNYDFTRAENLEQEYDFVYSCTALHHILDIETILTNLLCKLNDKGQLCIIDLDEDDGKFHLNEAGFAGHNGFNQAKLSRILEKVGYKDIKSHTFYHGVKKINDLAVNYSLFIMTGRKVK